MAVVALQATHTHTIKYATTKRKRAHKYEYEHAPRQRRDQHDEDEEEGHHCGLRVKPGQHPPPQFTPASATNTAATVLHTQCCITYHFDERTALHTTPCRAGAARGAEGRTPPRGGRSLRIASSSAV